MCRRAEDENVGEISVRAKFDVKLKLNEHRLMVVTDWVMCKFTFFALAIPLQLLLLCRFAVVYCGLFIADGQQIDDGRSERGGGAESEAKQPENKSASMPTSLGREHWMAVVSDSVDTLTWIMKYLYLLTFSNDDTQ